ncbi:hypothetical protein ACFL0Y_02470 [Patescibacteria group bacterium]
MSENCVGEVLGAATVLPATTAVSIFLANKAHPSIVAGFVLVNFLVLTVLLTRVTRYFINKK